MAKKRNDTRIAVIQKKNGGQSALLALAQRQSGCGASIGPRLASVLPVSVIHHELPCETIALVEATACQVEKRRAAIIFMTWHRLETEAARRLLFAEFTFDGRVIGLIEAIIATARQEHRPGIGPFSPIPLKQQDRASLAAMLEGALIGALSEVLKVSALILNAWREAFRFFMCRLAPA